MSVSQTNRLFAKISRSLARDKDLPLAQKLRKGLRYVSASLWAPMYLAACTRIGARARTVGRPLVDNRGDILIGDDFNVNSSFARVQLRAGPRGRLEIGDDVRVNFGTILAAQASVKIGSHTQIGPHCIVADTEWPDAAPQPVVVGDHVWLAGRVTVLPGARIGAGSVITAGSIVAGEIPAGVVAGGNPARVLRRIATDQSDTPGAEPAAEDHGIHNGVVRVEAPAVAPPSALTDGPALDGVAIADFTVDDLVRHLRQAGGLGVHTTCSVAPFGQVVPSLLDLGARPDEQQPDFAVVWTRPESVSPSFQRLASFETVELDTILREVDDFCDLLARNASRVRFVFVPTWVRPAFDRGLGLLDMRPQQGLANTLMHMNLRLAERLAPHPNVHVVHAQPWVQAGGEHAFSPKLWYMGKVPFDEQVFARAAEDITAALRSLTGQARKLLVLDLDDTLWGGTVGDVGWENLRLGGHDSVGEALVDFQHHLKALTRRGVVLGIASKNDEAVALEAIRSHPEMVLRLDDFVGWRISWNDKARGIAELAAELNLGLQSVVFIDDNPVERARVREALPEVLVPEWPRDKALYTSALLSLRCFDTPTISSEDLRRTEMYAQEREREDLRREVSSIEDWLRTLGTCIRVDELNAMNLPRTVQLLNKTNQMNLSTRRFTEAELRQWADEPGHSVWTFSVSDRFGDAGLTGILGLAVRGSTVCIVDFVLSCRVMGRGVERAMLHVAVEEARSRGLTLVEAQYVPTAKNRPCLEFLESAGLQREADGRHFRWLCEQPYRLPESVQLQVPVH